MVTAVGSGVWDACATGASALVGASVTASASTTRPLNERRDRLGTGGLLFSRSASVDRRGDGCANWGALTDEGLHTDHAAGVPSKVTNSTKRHDDRLGVGTRCGACGR